MEFGFDINYFLNQRINNSIQEDSTRNATRKMTPIKNLSSELTRQKRILETPVLLPATIFYRNIITASAFNENAQVFFPQNFYPGQSQFSIFIRKQGINPPFCRKTIFAREDIISTNMEIIPTEWQCRGRIYAVSPPPSFESNYFVLLPTLGGFRGRGMDILQEDTSLKTQNFQLPHLHSPPASLFFPEVKLITTGDGWTNGTFPRNNNNHNRDAQGYTNMRR